LEDVGQEAREAIRSHWVLFLIQGVIMIILGVLAVGEPMVATLAVTLFAGWLFLDSGIVGFAGMFTARHVPGFWWALITAVLAILVGIYLIWRPLSGTLSLTLAVGAFSARRVSCRSSPRSGITRCCGRGYGCWSPALPT
jgi:uncharacterized membrane protein HdeD (DUF308 family)